VTEVLALARTPYETGEQRRQTQLRFVLGLYREQRAQQMGFCLPVPDQANLFGLLLACSRQRGSRGSLPTVSLWQP